MELSYVYSLASTFKVEWGMVVAFYLANMQITFYRNLAVFPEKICHSEKCLDLKLLALNPESVISWLTLGKSFNLSVS